MAKETTIKKRRIAHKDNLSLKNIYIGQVDTTIELDINNKEIKNDFYYSYFIRNEGEVNSFLNGSKCFVYGQKGAGKTAFLRFIGEKLERDEESQKKFDLYLFSKDFPRAIYDDITEFTARKNDINPEDFHYRLNPFRDIDYENLWTFIILKKLNEHLVSGKCLKAKDDIYLERFNSLLKSAEIGSVLDRFARLLPRIHSGSARISKDPSVEMKLEFDGSKDDFVKFAEYIGNLKEVFKDISFVSGTYYMMFDEIDPRVGSGKAFDLDCILIRDLIITIYNLNRTQNKRERRLFICAAIRTEILREVNRLGKEVHKYLEALGVAMNWGEIGKRDVDHPLIRMICKKIIYSEKKFGIFGHQDEEKYDYIWKKYFRKANREALSPNELLRVSWMKPRDIVRRLNECKNIDGDSRVFTKSLLDRSFTTYSHQSWRDVQDQLSGSVGPDTVSALETVLSRFIRQFNINDLERRIDLIGAGHKKVKLLQQNFGILELLELLYFHGVIGILTSKNYTEYFFEGNTSPDFFGRICIHPGLIRKFNSKSITKKESGEDDLFSSL